MTSFDLRFAFSVGPEQLVPQMGKHIPACGLAGQEAQLHRTGHSKERNGQESIAAEGGLFRLQYTGPANSFRFLAPSQLNRDLPTTDAGGPHHCRAAAT